MNKIKLEFKIKELETKIENSIQIINETDKRLEQEIQDYPLREKIWEKLIEDMKIDKYHSIDEYIRYKFIMRELEEDFFDAVFEVFTVQGYEEYDLKKLREKEKILKEAKKEYF